MCRGAELPVRAVRGPSPKIPIILTLLCFVSPVPPLSLYCLATIGIYPGPPGPLPGLLWPEWRLARFGPRTGPQTGPRTARWTPDRGRLPLGDMAGGGENIVLRAGRPSEKALMPPGRIAGIRSGRRCWDRRPNRQAVTNPAPPRNPVPTPHRRTPRFWAYRHPARTTPLPVPFGVVCYRRLGPVHAMFRLVGVS